MSRQPNVQARERILESARGLIYKSGFKGVSMDDVAGEAGIKKANLFHYYPTKDALGLAVFEYATRGFRDRWAERFQDDPDPVKMVEAMFDSTRRGMQKQGCCGGCLIGNLAQELSDSNELLRRRVADHLQSWHRQLATYFSRLQAERYFRNEFDPYAGAQAILALFEGALLMAKATRKANVIENAKRMAVAYLELYKGGTTMGPKSPCGC